MVKESEKEDKRGKRWRKVVRFQVPNNKWKTDNVKWIMENINNRNNPNNLTNLNNHYTNKPIH